MEESLDQLRNANQSHSQTVAPFLSPSAEAIDQDLLHHAVQDAGQFGFGIKMVEIWVWNEFESKLFRPDGGWWIDPYWHQHQHHHESECRFCQLVDATRQDYIAPPQFSPGVGLPGVLWADLSSSLSSHRVGHRRRRSSRSGGGGGSRGGFDPTFLAQIFADDSMTGGGAGGADPDGPAIHGKIAWRDIQALSNDPDHPRHQRLDLIASTDLKWAGAVEFQIKAEMGLVLYYARQGVNLRKLHDNANTDYLRQAADFIGSAYVLRVPRRIAYERRQDELERNLIRVRQALLYLINQGVTIEQLAHPPSLRVDSATPLRGSLMEQMTDFLGHQRVVSFSRTAFDVTQRKWQQSVRKLRGGGTQPPPTSSWKQSSINLFGVLIGLLVISYMNFLADVNLGGAFTCPMGPLGALMGLLFGLSAAPAAQPRTIWLGQVVAMMIGLGIAQFPHLPSNVKSSLACALAVAAMSKFSVVNPPAASFAFIFASGNFGFSNILASLVGSTMAISFAIVINNLSNKRQYPSYWYILPETLVPSFSSDNTTNNNNHIEMAYVQSLLRLARRRKDKTSTEKVETEENAIQEENQSMIPAVPSTTTTVRTENTSSRRGHGSHRRSKAMVF